MRSVREEKPLVRFVARNNARMKTNEMTMSQNAVSHRVN